MRPWSYRLPYSNSPRTSGRVTKTVWPGWMSPLSHDVLSVQLRQVAVWVARVSFSTAIRAPGLTERTLGENEGEAAEPLKSYIGSGRVSWEFRSLHIFGFDPAVGLTPTNTFHVGFWFNDPNDAVACGFNDNNATPFNGEHHAGPLAMISRPDATTGLGPLCRNPNTSTVPPSCNP